ncbi:hypothetical protein ACFYXP_21175 [Streptomyces sp. NPDC002466]|uniref:hypothetical protein n=1 Tax=unclassified Streptomyces TaxID=2593676 RepID=UPI0035D7F385
MSRRGDEDHSLICTGWLPQALARIGRADEAAAVFNRLLELPNDVGLLAEPAGMAP